MKNKGFTLIELMIVVAIIGILAAVVIPAIQDRKSKDLKNIQNPQQTVYDIDDYRIPEKETVTTFESTDEEKLLELLRERERIDQELKELAK